VSTNFNAARQDNGTVRDLENRLEKYAVQMVQEPDAYLKREAIPHGFERAIEPGDPLTRIHG